MFLDSELHEPQTEEEEEQREEEVHSEARMHQRCCNAHPVGGGGGGGQEPIVKPGCINDAAMHPPVPCSLLTGPCKHSFSQLDAHP